MLKTKKTKIIATLGPSSCSRAIIEQLFLRGVDVFRLNFSHGTHDEHRRTYGHIRDIEKVYGVPIAVLMDLQGPKLRVGTFKNGPVFLEDGQHFSFTLDPVEGDSTRVTLPHREVFQALVPETLILMDDGKLQLEVLSCGPAFAETRVKVGGKISSHKGVNLPNVALPLRAVTEKDEKDLCFGLELGVDFIGLSFVQCPEDVMEAQGLIQGRAALVVKIEKPLALKNLPALIELADAVMVARGDLGVELFPEEVPPAQKHVIHACRQAGKPVIVATQMLESMLQAPTPTRAEVSDVANAVYDGADAVMLSGESAYGQHPVEAVSIMNRIIQSVEKDPVYPSRLYATAFTPQATTSDAITTAAVQATQTIGTRAIVSFTASGYTSSRLSRARPLVPIVGVSPSPHVARRQILNWGVYPVVNQGIKTYEDMIREAPHILLSLDKGYLGSSVILTAGEPLGLAGGTNILRILKLEEDPQLPSNPPTPPSLNPSLYEG